MLFKEDIKPEYFAELLNDKEKILKFISDIKWEDGFVCKNCGHTNFCKGKSPSSRRCTRCKKEESATSHTIFHNIKFPVEKAFYIAYNVCILGKNLSSYKYSECLGINQMTCWKFHKRIQECLNNQGKENSRINIQNIIKNTINLTDI